MKNIAYVLAYLLGLCFRFVPPQIISFAVINFVRAVSLARSPIEGIRLVLLIDKALYQLCGEQSIRYGNGTHTKHYHIGYHDFFCERIQTWAASSGKNNKDIKILDIGCGKGELAYDIAGKTGVFVTGIEMVERHYQEAKEKFKHSRVKYIHGDALKNLPESSFDIVIMSNVLEHLNERGKFLSKAQYLLTPNRWLFRVPLYERDWKVPLMKELGLDYRLDPTHCIEFTQVEFEEELRSVGFLIEYLEIRWGEIWCEAVHCSKVE